MADSKSELTEVASTTIKCFQVTFKLLEGFANVLGRKMEKQASSLEYVLRASTYLSGHVNRHVHETLQAIKLVDRMIQGESVVCPINQMCYFYSESQPPSLMLVLELVAKTTLLSGDQVCKGLGWTLMAIFDQCRKVNVGETGDRVRLPLYDGSPRVLYSLQQPPSPDGGHLVPIPGCILSITLLPHPILVRAIHLFPEHVLVSFDDIIPGTGHTSTPEAFPKIAKTQSVTLEKIRLLLLPSVDNFETQFIAALNDDLKFTDVIKIEERRLRFMPYNGWNFSSSSIITYLEKVSSDTPLHHTGSLKLHHSAHNHLVFRGSVELMDLVPHPLMEVVLQLEYVVTWTSPSLQSKESQIHSTVVTVCWGVWSPFTKEGEEMDREVSLSVELKAGIGYQLSGVPCSAHTVCYEGALTDAGKVIFRCFPTSMGHHSSFATLNNQPSTPAIGEGVEHTDSGVALDGHKMGHAPNSLPGSPVKSSTPIRQVQAHLKSSCSTPPLSVDIQSCRQSTTSSETVRWIETVPQSVLDYFHSSGVPEFIAKTGTAIHVPYIKPFTDTQPFSFSSSFSSASLKLPLCVGIQFMGFEMFPSTSSRPQWFPCRLVFSYQLYCLPVTRIKCRLITPCQPHVPHLLYMEKDVNMPASHEACISVHDFTLPVSTSTASKEVLQYLKKGWLSVTVYDGDSLIVVGTALIPTRLLLLQSPSDMGYYQTSVVVPVMSLNRHIDSLPADIFECYSNGRGSYMFGRLFVRLASLPPHQQLAEANSRRKSLMDVRQATLSLKVAQPIEDLNSQRHHHTQKTHSAQYASKYLPLSVNPVIDGFSIEQQQKHSAIQAMLLHTLTSSITLQPRLGEAIYFEHVFHNKRTLSTSSSILLSWNDINLMVVTNMMECQHLKKCFRQLSAIDGGNLLELDHPEINGEHQFTVYANERVRIPFRYQSYAVIGHNKEVKVYFQEAVTRDLLAVLTLHIRPQLHCVNRVYHFYHPEMTFMKKSFQVPQSEGCGGEHASKSCLATCNHGDMFVCCSDCDACCELKEQNNYIDVVLRIPVKPAPCVLQVYIMIFCDKFHITPKEIWQVDIHSVHRIDHSLVIGQSSSIILTLKGGVVNRHVSYGTSCTSSAIITKMVSPFTHLLPAHSVSEIMLSLKMLTSGSTDFIVTAVDMDHSQLLDAWLVHVAAQQPSISRAFHIALNLNGPEATAIRTITYTNPYQKRKKFQISTSRPDLLSFKPLTLKLQSSQTAPVKLLFSLTTPSTTPSVDIFVFINNANDKTEECFLVRSTYTSQS